MTKNSIVADKKIAPGKYLAWLLFLCVTAAAAVVYHYQAGRSRTDSGSVGDDESIAREISNRAIEDDSVTLRTQDGFVLVDVGTGQTRRVDDMKQEILEKSSGLPEIGEQEEGTVVKSIVIVSHDASMAIANVTKYRPIGENDSEVGEPAIETTQDYLCDITKHNCETTDILSKKYGDIGSLGEAMVSLDVWDEKAGMLYVRLFDERAHNYAYMLACDTTKGQCEKAFLGNESADSPSVTVPSGSFSADSENFALAKHSIGSTKSAEKLELAFFSRKDFSRPLATYDISGVMGIIRDSDDDGIQSMSWSEDKKKIAIATDTKIFLYTIESGTLVVLHDDAISMGDGSYFMDGSSLAYTPDGRFVVFVQRKDEPGEDSPVDAPDQPDILWKIDLHEGNRLSEVGKFFQMDFAK